MKHAMNQENMAHSQEKLTEMIPEEEQTLNLPDKDLKSTVLNMFKELKETMGKELKEIRKTMHGQNENINKETETVKRNQIKNMELKSIITEIKN